LQHKDNPLLSSWPFWVLELTPTAENADIEKSARDIINKIQFQLPGSEYYRSPDGSQKRDEFLIREAKSKLQDPKTRLLAEYWYIDPLIEAENTQQQDKLSIKDWYKEFGIQLWED